MLLSKKMNSIKENLILLGYEVQVSEKYIVVNLPLSCSVHIIEESNIFKTAVKFGSVSREKAYMLTLFMFIIFGVLIIIPDTTYNISLIFGISFIGAAIYDVYRYILTESFISRLQFLIVHLQEPSN